jgi:hypothetical protein
MNWILWKKEGNGQTKARARASSAEGMKRRVRDCGGIRTMAGANARRRESENGEERMEGPERTEGKRCESKERRKNTADPRGTERNAHGRRYRDRSWDRTRRDKRATRREEKEEERGRKRTAALPDAAEPDEHQLVQVRVRHFRWGAFSQRKPSTAQRAASRAQTAFLA